MVISGSATPGLSLDEIIKLSKDPEKTREAFKFNHLNFNLGSAQGSLELRESIIANYDASSRLQPQDIVVTNGTTGANHIVHQSLLKAGDHIICQYPIYGPCIEEPEYIGCRISYLQLHADDRWRLDLQELESLVRPGETKLLMINNPANPTGTHFTTELLSGIVALCRKHDIILHCDEIFRPLFHTDDIPVSAIELHNLGYDKVIVTASLSKSLGLSSVRIGWIASRSPELITNFKSYRAMSVSSTSLIDECIATEVLSPRCRPGILAKHLAMAKTNIALLQAFIDKNKDFCGWVPPTAGAVGFVRFKDPKTGAPFDDVSFCKELADSKKVVLAPATFCFEFGEKRNVFKGRVRMHFTTTTEKLQKGLALVDEFLEEKRKE